MWVLSACQACSTPLGGCQVWHKLFFVALLRAALGFLAPTQRARSALPARPSARPASLQVFVFSARGGQHTQQASLGMECEQEGVADAVVFPTGVVALSPLRHLWWVLVGWGGGAAGVGMSCV